MVNANAWSETQKSGEFITGQTVYTVTREGCIPMELATYHFTDASKYYYWIIIPIAIVLNIISISLKNSVSYNMLPLKSTPSY